MAAILCCIQTIEFCVMGSQINQKGAAQPQVITGKQPQIGLHNV